MIEVSQMVLNTELTFWALKGKRTDCLYLYLYSHVLLGLCRAVAQTFPNCETCVSFVLAEFKVHVR